MTWDEMMRRVLPPVGGVQPHVTGPAGGFGTGEAEGRRKPSTIPHIGLDFNFIGGQNALNKSHPGLHSPVAGVVLNAGEGNVGRIAIRDANGFVHEILHTDTGLRSSPPMIDRYQKTMICISAGGVGWMPEPACHRAPRPCRR